MTEANVVFGKEGEGYIRPEKEGHGKTVFEKGKKGAPSF